MAAWALLVLACSALAEDTAAGCEDAASNCTEWANLNGGLTGCGKLPGVLLNCAATCGACSIRKTVELATRCDFEDQHPECYEWAKSGQCEMNPGYMIRHCPAACGDYGSRMSWMAGRLAIIENCERQEYVPEGCADRLPDCAEYAQTTLAGCGQHIGLLLSCPETCAACPHYTMLEMATRCEDKNEMCAKWAKRGECGNNTQSACHQTNMQTVTGLGIRGGRGRARTPDCVCMGHRTNIGPPSVEPSVECGCVTAEGGE